MTGLVCAWCDQPSAGFASLPEPFLVGLDAGTRWPSCGAEGHGVDYLSREERHRVMQAEHAAHAEARAAGLPLDEIIRLAAGGFRLEESEVERLGAEVERLRAWKGAAEAILKRVEVNDRPALDMLDAVTGEQR